MFSAIVSEYDLSNDEAYEQVRTILDALKDTAVAEEATGFDPSGSTSIADTSPEQSTADSTASPGTDLTSLSAALSSVGISDDQSHSAVEDLEAMENLDNDSKARLIRDVFPSLSEFTITHTLKRNQYKWMQTLDDLLNQVFIHADEEGPKDQAKGIEAFSEENTIRRGRKSKKKKASRMDLDERRASSLPVTPNDDLPKINKWQMAGEDVGFIASRVHLPPKAVAYIYNLENASIKSTIAKILNEYLQKNKSLLIEDPIIQVDAFELMHDFPGISDDHRLALAGITRQSASDARDLAEALTSGRGSQDSIPAKIIPQYAPLRMSEDDGRPTVLLPRATTRSSLDFASASATASSFAEARQQAMSQARAAYRKAKSNRLMGGAAAYYSDVGREMYDSQRVASAATADALVASQSGPSYVDLHGVTAEDAVRIACVRVNQWWNRLAENRYNGRLGADERAQGFQIITGAGRHSKGGKGVLGPAVKKSLEKEGWKIEVKTGEIVVRGR